MIAVIPARSGSKRLPRKNVADFMGRPLIAWTIDAAIEFGRFDRILVSTDDEEIAQVARTCGAAVPFLRLDAYDDVTPVSVATIAAIQQASAYWQEEYDIVVQLMANCPARRGIDIAQAVEHFERGAADFQISCFRYGFMNPWWATQLDEAGRPKFLHPDALKMRSQDLPALYCPTGAIWMARAQRLIAAGTFYGPGHTFHPIDWKAAVDIDDRDDLELAAAVFAMRRQA